MIMIPGKICYTHIMTIQALNCHDVTCAVLHQCQAHMLHFSQNIAFFRNILQCEIKFLTMNKLLKYPQLNLRHADLKCCIKIEKIASMLCTRKSLTMYGNNDVRVV